MISDYASAGLLSADFKRESKEQLVKQEKTIEELEDAIESLEGDVAGLEGDVAGLDAYRKFFWKRLLDKPPVKEFMCREGPTGA